MNAEDFLKLVQRVFAVGALQGTQSVLRIADDLAASAGPVWGERWADAPSLRVDQRVEVEARVPPLAAMAIRRTRR